MARWSYHTAASDSEGRRWQRGVRQLSSVLRTTEMVLGTRDLRTSCPPPNCQSNNMPPGWNGRLADSRGHQESGNGSGEKPLRACQRQPGMRGEGQKENNSGENMNGVVWSMFPGTPDSRAFLLSPIQSNERPSMCPQNHGAGLHDANNHQSSAPSVHMGSIIMGNQITPYSPPCSLLP